MTSFLDTDSVLAQTTSTRILCLFSTFSFKIEREFFVLQYDKVLDTVNALEKCFGHPCLKSWSANSHRRCLFYFQNYVRYVVLFVKTKHWPWNRTTFFGGDVFTLYRSFLSFVVHLLLHISWWAKHPRLGGIFFLIF